MVLIKSSEIRPPVSSHSKTKELMIPSALLETDADPDPDLVEFSPGVITRSIGLLLILPILWTTNITFLVEIRKVILSLFHQEKRIWALLESNLLGIS